MKTSGRYIQLTVENIDVETGSAFSGVEENNGRQEYRLLNVDAPEESEPGYEKAKEYLKSLIDGKPITVLINTHDPKGRNLVRATTDDGKSVNEYMKDYINEQE